MYPLNNFHCKLIIVLKIYKITRENMNQTHSLKIHYENVCVHL